MPSAADIIKDYVSEFSRLQDWMIPNETPRSKLRGISPRLTSFVISLLRSKLRGIKPSLGLNKS